MAYEPVGPSVLGGVPASPAYAAERHRTIRETLRRLFGDEKGQEIPVLYGGSVNRRTPAAFFGIDNVDGLFIGRSAWDARNFTEIIELACETAGLIKKSRAERGSPKSFWRNLIAVGHGQARREEGLKG